eukprot:403376071
MGNCNNCDCNQWDKKYEYDDNKVEEQKGQEPLMVSQKRVLSKNNSEIRKNTAGSRTQLRSQSQQQAQQAIPTITKEQLEQFNKKYGKQIIRFQSLWRGYRIRQQLKVMLQQQNIKKKYFLDDEFHETLSKQKKFEQKQKLIQKEYVYKTTGAKYSGEWLGGFRQGKGVMQWQDGAFYEGLWDLGRAQGKGKFTHSKGEIYEGQWFQDKAHGHGVYIHSNGARYEGQWFKDLQHGFGKEEWPDGSMFEGQYKEGKKNGLGNYKWADGAQYEGEWLDNEIAGYGFYQWSDGRKYVGHWKSNIMDEFGVYSWQDGRLYEGFYKEDKKYGFGVYTWSDNKQYAGWWHNGKQHGLGIFLSKEGKKKYGIWEDGKKLRWFSSEEVEAIEQNILSLGSLFENSESSMRKYKNFPVQFSEPAEFKQCLVRLQQEIKELKLPVDISQFRIKIQS